MGIGKEWKKVFDKESYRSEVLKEIEAYEAPFLKDKLLEKEVFKNEEEYNEAFTEFKRYVGLVTAYDKPLPMLSDRVDDVWHQFILFTKEYDSFCKEKLGYFLHDVPEDPRGGKLERLGFTREDFIELYDKTYGAIPEIWGIKEDEVKELNERKKK